MSWSVYIARSRTNRYYTGITEDSVERIKQHNSGVGARLARQQGPFELVYESAKFSSKSAARLREMQIKGWTRSKKELLIRGVYE